MGLEALYLIGLLGLAAALAYGIMRSSKRNKANDPIREEATKQLYDNPEAYEAGGKERLEKKLKPE